MGPDAGAPALQRAAAGQAGPGRAAERHPGRLAGGTCRLRQRPNSTLSATPSTLIGDVVGVGDRWGLPGKTPGEGDGVGAGDRWGLPGKAPGEGDGVGAGDRWGRRG